MNLYSIMYYMDCGTLTERYVFAKSIEEIHTKHYNKNIINIKLWAYAVPVPKEI